MIKNNTPSYFTGVDFAVGCGPLTIMLTPVIPPDESTANHLRCCLDVKASTEIVVALQSHEAFSP